MSFLTDYLEFNSGNESPQKYHIWCCLNVMSAIVSRKVWLDFNYYQLYPNLYVVLVGPAGNRKTTALSCAKQLIREMGNIPYSAECQTKESICKEWQELQREWPQPEKPIIYTPYAIFVTELSQFIGVDPARMIDFLTTVYDQDYYDLKTKNKGSQYIVGPYITLLACTTQEWITSYLRLDIISGGFSRRCVFVNEDWDEKKRIPFPEITPAMRAAWQRVVSYAHELQTVAGPFTWADDARIKYDSWYRTRDITREPTVSGFDRTKYNQILKVAMLLSLSERLDRVLTLSNLEDAMQIVDDIMVNLPKVFTGMGRNDLNAVRAKIANLLTQSPMTTKRVISMMYSEAKDGDIREVLRVMQECGQIVEVKQTYKATLNGVEKECTRMWLALKTDDVIDRINAASQIEPR